MKKKQRSVRSLCQSIHFEFYRLLVSCLFMYFLSLSYCFQIFTAVSVHRLHIDDNSTIAFRFSYLQSIRCEFCVGLSLCVTILYVR